MPSKPICLIGDPDDLSNVYMGWLADRRGIPVVTLPEDTFGIDWRIDYDDLQPGRGSLETDGRRYRFDALGGTFVRFNPEPGLPDRLELSDDERAVLMTERRAAIQHFINTLPCAVANRPAGGRSNGAKPHHMRLLAAAGFEVPPWIVTNDPNAVRAFVRDHPEGAVYKSCSGLRSEVRTLDDAVVERLAASSTPIIVQSYVRGSDARLHTVGEHGFATRIRASGIDYRFHAEDARYSAIDAPPEIRRLCSKFARADGLLVAGTDFRVTDAGQWYCLEMNPVPTFLPYEMETGHPIGATILDALLDG